MLKFDVLNRFSGNVQFTADIDCAPDAPHRIKLGLAIKWAIKNDADMRGADMRDANMSDADMRYADMCYANMRGANMCYADMRGANMCGADMRGANMRGVDMRDANMRAADMRGANMRGADMRGANMRDANMCYANMRGANMRGADMRDADMSGADMSGVDMRGADMSGQWIIQGATRSDGYPFFLQKLTGDAEPMVKAGCHYFTLSKAQAHWEKSRAGTVLLTETFLIVRCMVEIAHARGFMVNGSAAP